MCENEVCWRVEKLKTLQSIKGQEKRNKKRGNDEWRSKQRDGRESGEPSQAFGCLCYQFVQKCQSGVTFSPTASPAARPLFSNTTPSAADNTNTEVRAERANKRCSAAYCMQYSIEINSFNAVLPLFGLVQHFFAMIRKYKTTIVRKNKTKTKIL